MGKVRYMNNNFCERKNFPIGVTERNKPLKGSNNKEQNEGNGRSVVELNCTV